MTSAYIAGPMRGIDQFNFPAFDEAAANLRSIGWTVFSPAEHDRESGFDETRNTLEGFDIKQAFQWDCNRVCEADFIVLLPGWEKSQGVAAELEHGVGGDAVFVLPGSRRFDRTELLLDDGGQLVGVRASKPLGGVGGYGVAGVEHLLQPGDLLG